VKLSFRLGMLSILASIVLMTSSVAGAHETIRWDTISLTFPNGVGTINAGGSDYALADDLTTIQISGHGTFSGLGEPVTGGGTWATSGPSAGPSGTAKGTFTVTAFVRFEAAPGSLPPGFVDNIGDGSKTRSGLAVLRIVYSDGSKGTLLISCHQPVGSPSGIFEGITATKGFVAFHERVPPVPGVNANRTLFHVVP
jgi:hypothetical protein